MLLRRGTVLLTSSPVCLPTCGVRRRSEAPAERTCRRAAVMSCRPLFPYCCPSCRLVVCSAAHCRAVSSSAASARICTCDARGGGGFRAVVCACALVLSHVRLCHTPSLPFLGSPRTRHLHHALSKPRTPPILIATPLPNCRPARRADTCAGRRRLVARKRPLTCTLHGPVVARAPAASPHSLLAVV
jgi:hypothetical protein